MKTVMVERSTLTGAPYNPRRISKGVIKQLSDSIETFGFVQPLVVRKADGLIVGGHQRLLAFDSLVKSKKLPKDSKVPVVYVDGDDDRMKVLNLALNKIQGEWDYQKLPDVLASLPEVSWELAGFSAIDVQDMLRTEPDADLADAISLDEKPAEDKALAEPEAKGKVFQVRMPVDDLDFIESTLKRFGSKSHGDRGTVLAKVVRLAVDAADKKAAK